MDEFFIFYFQKYPDNCFKFFSQSYTIIKFEFANRKDGRCGLAIKVVGIRDVINFKYFKNLLIYPNFYFRTLLNIY